MRKVLKSAGIAIVVVLLLMTSVLMATAERQTTTIDGVSEDLNGVTITVKEIITSGGGGHTLFPDEGNKFLAVVFEFENNTDEEFRVMSGDFNFFADNLAVSWSATASVYIDQNTSTSRLSATLAPGTRAIGNVSVELPIDTEVLRVDYSRGRGENERSTTFNFNVQDLASDVPAPATSEDISDDVDDGYDFGIELPILGGSSGDMSDEEIVDLLIGTWQWTTQEGYLMAFQPNGNLNAGWTGLRVSYTWEVRDGNLYIDHENTNLRFSHNDTRIILTWSGGVHTYTRYSDDYDVGTSLVWIIIGLICCCLVFPGAIVLVIILIVKNRKKKQSNFNPPPQGFGPPAGFDPTQPPAPQPPAGNTPDMFGPATPPPAAPPGQEANTTSAEMKRCSSCGAATNQKFCEYCGTMV